MQDRHRQVITRWDLLFSSCLECGDCFSPAHNRIIDRPNFFDMVQRLFGRVLSMQDGDLSETPHAPSKIEDPLLIVVRTIISFSGEIKLKWHCLIRQSAITLRLSGKENRLLAFVNKAFGFE